MWNQAIFLISALNLLPTSLAYVWELTKGADFSVQEGFQRIPSHRETADKFMKTFLGLEPPTTGRIRRSARGPYTSFDIIFVIDASNSIRPAEFTQTLRALHLLTKKAQPETKYAAISFSNHATIRFNFTGKSEAVAGIRGIPFERGATNTEAALDMCRTQLVLNTNSGARPGVQKRVLIVTDGQSNVEKELTLYRAYQLKSTGTQVFVIAVGSYLSGIDEIVGLASSTDAHLYRVADAQGLVRVMKLIPPWHRIKDYKKYRWLGGMLQRT